MVKHLTDMVAVAVESLAPHSVWWLGLFPAAGIVLGAAGWVRWRRRGQAALKCRTAVDLVPAYEFDPSMVEIERHAARLARVPAESGWPPRRAAGVRVRHWSVDGNLATRLEGPDQSAYLLRLPSFAAVEVLEADRSASTETRPIRFTEVDPVSASSGREK
ncbi:hypothetical protein [Streptomyces sp. NPDC056010]|uniref:hypothetical protein n=1 Tax=Streptomyces sp. NPDC056010 TaxID=3345679 RepID=UPI0035D807F2